MSQGCRSQIAALHRQASHRRGLIALAGGLPAGELLPRDALADALVRAARDDEALQYGWPEGLVRLRTWIASRLAARGVDVDATRVIVTAGAQQALALVASALPRGSRIAVGEATYPLALEAFARGGLAVVARDPCARTRYVVPGVANPHGIETTDRAALIASGAELVVDEAYAELRFDGRVPRPLACDVDRVWHIGTISKTVCPGLRLGWLVPPENRHARILESKQATDLHTCSVAQAALVRLLELIDYDELVARARLHYAARAERLVVALARHAPRLRFREPTGGFSIWVETDEAGNDVRLLEAAIDAGVTLDPGSLFRADGESSPVAFRISFSHAPIDALAEGARRLANALATWRPRAARPSVGRQP